MKDTKEFILETAFKLFLSKTYKEVTMKEIVNATGLSKGAFYHYFESKEQLFLEVINDYLISKIVLDYNQFDNSSLYAFYHAHIDKIVSKTRDTEGVGVKIFKGEDVTYSDLYTLIFEAIKFFPEIKKKFIEFDVYKLNFWTNMVQKARLNGEIKSDMNDENIAKIFLSIMESTGIRLALTLDDGSRKARLTALWGGFYNQLKS